MPINSDDSNALDIGSSDGNPTLAPVVEPVDDRPVVATRDLRPETFGLQSRVFRGQGGWRRPNDGLGDTVSRSTSLRFDDGSKQSRDTTRQEFADETDILFQLRRFGVAPANTRLPQYGEVDYDLDLLRAYELVNQARGALAQLPEEVLEEHGGIDGLLDKIQSGELETLEKPVDLPPAKPAEPPVGGAGGPLPPSPAPTNPPA